MMMSMKKIHRNLLLISLVLLLSGCLRLATSPTVDLSRFTPQPEDVVTAQIGESVVPDLHESLTPTPNLDSATQRVLRIYPLWVGSSWVYQYLGYDQDLEVLWRVVETVVDTRIVEGYYVVEIERTTQLLEGTPGENFLSVPDEGTYWYLIDGEDLYRFDSALDTDLSGAWLDLVIPFPDDEEAWFPNPDQRAKIIPGVTGLRYASEPFKKVLPMGGTYTCYNITTRYVDGTAEGTFCENVGYVYQEFNQNDQAFGYRSELIGFSLQ
jgi:hypothetical protein